MRKLYMIVFLVISGLLMGQTQRVSQKIDELTTGKQIFQNYSLFTKDLNQKTQKYISSATDVTVLDLNSGELNRIINEAPQFITLNVPYLEGDLPVKLYKHEVTTDNFYAVTESGLPINYTPGQYYRGIVEGDMNSLAAISFFDNDVVGVISTLDKGNVVLGKSSDQSEYITYSDANLLGTTSFECGADDLAINKEIRKNITFDPSALAPDETDYCVGIYYEIGYKPYQQKSKDLAATLDWITAIQNNIGTLYDNDGIDVAISSIRVWTIPDPYSGGYGDNLYDFAQNTADFDGDLAHLVTTPATTSVAFLDSLCSDWTYAYSAIDMYFGEVPVYSWTIMAMTHEMGHSMGSPHTHACAWNGDNTAIDGCGPAAGYSEGCNGPIPPNGGTIMSYCHLTNVGINFVNGFGEQPSALIRNTINSKSCLSSDCVSEPQACIYSIDNVKINYTSEGDIQVSFTDAGSTEWRYAAVPYKEGFPSTWVSTTSTEFDLSELNLEDHKYYDLYIQNVCENGMGGVEKALILTGNFCDGTLFTDTGGEGASYSNNEYLVKTFYPSAPDSKVSIDFDHIGLQNNNDFLYVYDGDSEDSPLFDGGEITGFHNPGPVFTSTHSSGAITVKFVSDDVGFTSGWEAVVDCAFLDVSDLSGDSGIVVYPNPTEGTLYIISKKEKVENIRLTDVTGRTVLTQKQISTQEQTLDIRGLPSGVYILTLKAGKQRVTKKVVKK